MALPEKILVDTRLLLGILEHLRLAPIAALKDSPNDHLLPEDFKPHKWEDFEVVYAEGAKEMHKELLATMEAAVE